MNPAFSVIFLTTLIGAGQGLFLALYAVEVGALFGLAAPRRSAVVLRSTARSVAFAFARRGLVASFFHLGRPERAWRAAAHVAHVVAVARSDRAAGVHGRRAALCGAHCLTGRRTDRRAHDPAIGAARGVVLCLALFVCTGMIYACIKFLQEWATPLTVVNFMLLGSRRASRSAAALRSRAPRARRRLSRLCALIVSRVAGLATRVASLARNARLRPKSTLQTAIGIKHPRIVQKSQGFMGGSFNTREFFHGRDAGVRAIGEVAVPARWRFVVPAVLLALASRRRAEARRSSAAFVVQYAGLDRRALVLLRAGEAPAEPLLPGSRVGAGFASRRRSHRKSVVRPSTIRSSGA